ncbi:hypothetical protein PABG_11333 [Paracoccidioides brasiliensis Pb03]|nr:hypothetical protein PABG_11333 [Paracoccidioides brasiliensis Pb03]
MPGLLSLEPRAAELKTIESENFRSVQQWDNPLHGKTPRKNLRWGKELPNNVRENPERKTL